MDEEFHFDELAAAESVAERIRRRSLAVQQAEASTFAGVLAEGAESRLAVQLDLHTGVSVSGVLVATNDRVIQLVDDAGCGVAVAVLAVAAVRGPSARLLSGMQPGDDRTSIASWLRDRMEWQTMVQVQTRGAHRYRGEISAVGHDVVMLTQAGSLRSSCWIGIDSIVLVRESPSN